MLPLTYTNYSPTKLPITTKQSLPKKSSNSLAKQTKPNKSGRKPSQWKRTTVPSIFNARKWTLRVGCLENFQLFMADGRDRFNGFPGSVDATSLIYTVSRPRLYVTLYSLYANVALDRAWCRMAFACDVMVCPLARYFLGLPWWLRKRAVSQSRRGKGIGVTWVPRGLGKLWRFSLWVVWLETLYGEVLGA